MLYSNNKKQDFLALRMSINTLAYSDLNRIVFDRGFFCRNSIMSYRWPQPRIDELHWFSRHSLKIGGKNDLQQCRDDISVG